MTADEVLKGCFWGWQKEPDGEEAFRAPLPATARFPLRTRGCGNIDGVTELSIPPYIWAAIERGELHVDLYDGSGWRAGYDVGTRTEDHCVYLDGGGIPPEWHEAITVAMGEIIARWPNYEPVFRPSADFRNWPR